MTVNSPRRAPLETTTMTSAPHMISETPSQEEFDAMPDTAFADWWDARIEAVQAAATSEAEVQDAVAGREAAWSARWG